MSISCREWLSSALALFLILLAGGADSQGQSAAAAAQASAIPIVLTNVRIIDGTGAPAMTNQSLVIEDGKIKTMGPSLQIAS